MIPATDRYELTESEICAAQDLFVDIAERMHGESMVTIISALVNVVSALSNSNPAVTQDEFAEAFTFSLQAALKLNRQATN